MQATTAGAPAPSVNALAGKIVEQIAADATALRISASQGSLGERLIDMGAQSLGCLEAGRRLGEVCLGGLGTVQFTTASGVPKWPLGVVVSSTNPIRRLDAPRPGERILRTRLRPRTRAFTRRGTLQASWLRR